MSEHIRVLAMIGSRVVFDGETEYIYAYLASAAVLVAATAWEEPLSNVVDESKAVA